MVIQASGVAAQPVAVSAALSGAGKIAEFQPKALRLSLLLADQDTVLVILTV